MHAKIKYGRIFIYDSYPFMGGRLFLYILLKNKSNILPVIKCMNIAKGAN